MREHSARVYRLAYRLSGNQQDAEDLTQETFVRVFRSLADYTPGTFEGWLHRITTNLFLDMVRRRQRIRFDALPDDTERLPGRERSPEQVYAETRLRRGRCRPRSTRCRRTSAPPWCSATSRACRTRRSRRPSGIKLGTVRSPHPPRPGAAAGGAGAPRAALARAGTEEATPAAEGGAS